MSWADHWRDEEGRRSAPDTHAAHDDELLIDTICQALTLVVLLGGPTKASFSSRTMPHVAGV